MAEGTGPVRFHKGMRVVPDHGFERVSEVGEADDVPAWSRRLKACALDLSDAEVARRVGISQSRYASYTSGIREPSLATLVTT